MSAASLLDPPPTIPEICLVEDNPGDAALILDLLDREEQHCPVAATMREAEKLLRERAFDVVLLDLNLPDARGTEGLRRALPIAEGAAIVVLTGLDEEELALECLALGAQDYIAKADLNARGLDRSLGYALARMRERREHDRAREMERRLAIIVDASDDAILGIDGEGRLTGWNHGAERLFGIAAPDALGRRIEDATGIDGIAGGERQMRTVEVIRLDGRSRTLSLSAFPLPDEADAAGMGAICRDVTEQVRSQLLLVRQNAALLDREAQLTALAARLDSVREEEQRRISREVHDSLGQLLTATKLELHGLAREIADGLVPPGHVDAIVKLVEETIAVARRIAAELRPSSLDVLGLAAAIGDEGRSFAARTGIEVDCMVASWPLPPPAKADAIFRILQEMLTNVARHSRAAHVTIAFAADPEQWRLEVLDDGIGVPVPLLPQGSLGILGMRERARLHGGTVEIDRGPDGGTCAIARLPRQDASS